MTKADDIKTLRDASAALADIADRISCGGPKPDFTIARQVAVNRFNASPIWKKLKGTPWENDAPTIAAELMCMYAAECRVVSSLMAGEGDRWTKKMIDERDQVIANEAWNAALQAGIDYVKEIVGDQATAKLNAFEVYAALNTLRKEPS